MAKVVIVVGHVAAAAIGATIATLVANRRPKSETQRSEDLSVHFGSKLAAAPSSADSPFVAVQAESDVAKAEASQQELAQTTSPPRSTDNVRAVGSSSPARSVNGHGCCAHVEVSGSLDPDAVLPFSDWAACMILGITHLSDELRFQHMYEALRTIAALYLRADVQGIVDVINIYKLVRVLLAYVEDTFLSSSSLAALDLTTHRACAGTNGTNGKLPPISLADVVAHRKFRQLSQEFAASRQKSLQIASTDAAISCPLGRIREDADDRMSQPASPKGCSGASQALHERRQFSYMCASRKMLRYLMEELEALLTAYLSRGWQDIDAVLAANSMDLRNDGLVCKWDRANAERELASPPSLSVISVASSSSISDDAANRAVSKRSIKNWHRAYQAVMKSLAVRFLRPAREFKTLQQMLKELNKAQPPRQEGRQPHLLFLGGGMAAGKSTVREIIGKDQKWSTIGKEAVIIEADAIKNQDVVFQELLKRNYGDGAAISEFVHEWSTKQAESMLVTALNQQKDIIFDGTCSWAPFVEQTIAMARDYRHDYQLGSGYIVHPDQTVTERYWQVADAAEKPHKQPYRIELIGVTCNASLAVARGIWRKLRSGRGVPIRSQLRSFKLFASNWEKYCQLVDSATLYHTGSELTTMNKESSSVSKPCVIAHMSESTRGEMLVNPRCYPEFVQQVELQVDADGECDLYPCDLCHTEDVMRKPKQVQERASVLRSAFRFGQDHKLV